MKNLVKIFIMSLLFFTNILYSSTSIHNTYSYEELNRLIADDRGVDDYFGWSVSISGDYAIVGSYYDDDNGSNSGSAYIFKKDSNGFFTQTDKLFASDASSSDYFGASVSISGDYAIVGAHGDDDNGSSSGSAYIFKRDGNGSFTQTDKLTANDGSIGNGFGGSVVISGDYAIVGARGAYIFKNDGNGTFTQVDKLLASDGVASDNFGYSVSISGDYAIVGAYADDDNGSSSGSAYIFKNNGSGDFNETNKLIASDGASGDWFGWSVSISGNYAIIGAPFDTYNDDSLGSAYIFMNDGSGNFIETNKLHAIDGADEDDFGYSVAISGDYAIVGAEGNDDDGDGSGSAYIFKKDSNGDFIETDKLTASDGMIYDYLGYSVAIDHDYAIVGAYGNEAYSGSAYIFNPTIKTSTQESNTSFSLEIDAIETTSYSISGLDSSLFDINASTGEITFKEHPDYEAPDDNNTDNIYELSVNAIGSISTDIKSVKIKVIDSPTSIENTYSYEELNKLIASDGEEDDFFATSVSISGDYAIFGGYGDSDNGSYAGSAYIFKNDGNGSFTQLNKLLDSYGKASEYFGYSVSISGEYAIVGVYGDNDNGYDAGSASIFKNDGNGSFIQLNELLTSDGAAYDNFGLNVSISGDYAIVGAPGDDDNGNESGSAYIFKNDGNDTFIEIAKLITYDGAIGDKFGRSVAINGDYIIVGAYYDDTVNGSNSGSAYIFKNDGNDTFTQIDKLIASDGAVNDTFGASVSLDGNYAIIGASNNNESGSAYIFKNDGYDNFSQTDKLIASNAVADDEFGNSVDISGDYAIVGAAYHENNNSLGSSYIFKNNGAGDFTEIDNLVASDGGDEDEFGVSVAISNDYAIVGANYATNSNGMYAGSAYVFNSTIKTSTQENNTSFSLEIDAIETTSYSISGLDSSLFDINASTGEITFKISPDYEIPEDNNTDNIYELSITASGDSNVTKTIKIAIVNADETPPSSYTVAFIPTSIDYTQTSTSTFSFTNAELGSTYNYTVSSSRGGSIVGSGTITTLNEVITLGDLSSLMDGTLTLNVYLTDASGNIGSTVSHTVILNAVEEGLSINILDSSTSESNIDNNATFTVVLKSIPEFDVVIFLNSSDTTEGEVTIPLSKSLSFSQSEWNIPQLVTVVGVSDSEADGDIQYTIDLNTTSSDTEYEAKTANVSLFNSDDAVGINPSIIMYLLN